MKIECKNIVDFCELISISIGQDIKDKCVFISSEKSYPSVSFENSKKDNIKFTYVFFTPLYTAIYSGNIKSSLATEEYQTLEDFCLKNNVHIHSFEKMKYISDTDSLMINTHLETK